MPSLEEVVEVVCESTGCPRRRVGVDTMLQADLGVYGDDMAELLADYAERFHVDMSSYLWFFHTGEEGSSFPFSLLFPPPNQRVTEIPISVQLLLDCANAGRWSVEYPEHSIPKRG